MVNVVSNLVISDGAKSSVKNFTSLFGIFTTISSSTKRCCVISDHTQTLTLKQVCEAGWGARLSAVQAIVHQHVQVRDGIARAVRQVG